MPAKDKNSSFLQTFINNSCKKFYKIWLWSVNLSCQDLLADKWLQVRPGANPFWWALAFLETISPALKNSAGINTRAY
jgi:hypothetical protein